MPPRIAAIGLPEPCSFQWSSQNDEKAAAGGLRDANMIIWIECYGLFPAVSATWPVPYHASG
jgi:hypothetical protein